jgi:hypothetical protein
MARKAGEVSHLFQSADAKRFPTHRSQLDEVDSWRVLPREIDEKRTFGAGLSGIPALGVSRIVHRRTVREFLTDMDMPEGPVVVAGRAEERELGGRVGLVALRVHRVAHLGMEEGDVRESILGQGKAARKILGDASREMAAPRHQSNSFTLPKDLYSDGLGSLDEVHVFGPSNQRGRTRPSSGIVIARDVHDLNSGIAEPAQRFGKKPLGPDGETLTIKEISGDE